MKVKLNENNEDHASEKVLPSIISHKLESPTEQELIEPMEFFDPKTKPIVPMAFYEGKGKGEDAQRQQDNSIVDSWNEVVPSTNKSTTNFKLYPPKHIENISNVAEKSNQRFKVNAYNTEQELLQKQNLIVIKNHLHYFNGKYYEKLSDEDAHGMILDFCRAAVADEGSTYIPTEVYKFLKMERSIRRTFDEIQRCEIVFQNGVFNVQTKQFYAHSPRVIATYALQCNYLHNRSCHRSHCPNFAKFLDEITGNDYTLQNRIWEMIGYVLTPDLQGKVLFLLQGVHDSGKSLLAKFISSFFSSDEVSALDIHSLSEKFAPSELYEKALCVSSDMPAGALDKKSVGKLKQLTGNDMISAPERYKKNLQFYATSKFILVTNHLFLTQERDDAFIERIVAIPFFYTVPKDRRNPALFQSFLYEKDVIATIAIQYYLNLLSRNYKFSGDYYINNPAAISESTGDCFDIDSRIYEFTINNFVPNENKRVPIMEAHKAFEAMYGKIDHKAFSHRFVRYTNELYGSTKTRYREGNVPNAINCVFGIDWRCNENDLP